MIYESIQNFWFVIIWLYYGKFKNTQSHLFIYMKNSFSCAHTYIKNNNRLKLDSNSNRNK